MNKFTTEQLKAALAGLRSKTDADSEAAFQMIQRLLLSCALRRILSQFRQLLLL